MPRREQYKKPEERMIYLAGPIDGLVGESTWRDEVAAEFPEVLFFHPERAYSNAKPSTARLMDAMNRNAINVADAVVANLCDEGRGFGTIREIEFARALSHYVGVAARPDDIGEHTLMAHDIHLFATPVDAVFGALAFMADSRANQPPSGMLMLGIPRPPEDEEEHD